MNDNEKVSVMYGTSLDRVKWLGHRMAATCERELANVGESKLACDYLIENLTEKIKRMKVDDLPKSEINKLIRSVPQETWDAFLDSVPVEVLQSLSRSIHTEKSRMAVIRMAAQSFTQCIIDSQGEDMPLPNLEVDERDGKTIFNFIIDEKDLKAE